MAILDKLHAIETKIGSPAISCNIADSLKEIAIKMGSERTQFSNIEDGVAAIGEVWGSTTTSGGIIADDNGYTVYISDDENVYNNAKYFVNKLGADDKVDLIFLDSAPSTVNLSDILMDNTSGSSFTTAPKVRSIIFSDSISEITSSLSLGLDSLESLSFGAGPCVISGYTMFSNLVAAITEIDFNGVTEIGSGANAQYVFAGARGLTKIVGNNVTFVGNGAFTSNSNLKTIEFPNCETISDGAFSSCGALTEFPYMPKLKTIGQQAFSSCTGLRSVELFGDVETIGANAFNAPIETITIHKAEGSITGAPWGASNAEVIWTE